MFHNCFFHSSTDGHLDCFQILAIVNSTAVNVEAYILFELVFQHSLQIFLEVEPLKQKAVLFSVL